MNVRTQYVAGYEAIGGIRRCFQASGDLACAMLHKIIEFYKQYGEQATKEAFGTNRKVISRWQKKIRRHEGAL